MTLKRDPLFDGKETRRVCARRLVTFVKLEISLEGNSKYLPN